MGQLVEFALAEDRAVGGGEEPPLAVQAALEGGHLVADERRAFSIMVCSPLRVPPFRGLVGLFSTYSTTRHLGVQLASPGRPACFAHGSG
jgi:hypothetical protein